MVMADAAYGKTILPYGAWHSPITENTIIQRVVFFESLKVDPASGNVYWSALEPARNGLSDIFEYKNGRSESCLKPPFSAHSAVNSYGGGEFTVYNHIIYFSNEKDNRLYELKSCGGKPVPITPSGRFRYADCTVDRFHQALYCVREEPLNQQHSTNALIRIDLSTRQVAVVAKGNDFYSSPALSPNGKKIAWLTWNFPNMPWDHTQLWVGDIGKAGEINNTRLVFNQNNVSVYQPQWSPTNILYFIADQTGWWNLYRFENNKIESLHPDAAEYGIAAENFGTSTYSFINDEWIAASYVQNGHGHLGLLNTKTRVFTLFDLPYIEFGQVRSDKNFIYSLAAGLYNSPVIMKLNWRNKNISILQTSRDLAMKSEYFSTPEYVSYQTADGHTAYANYYPPHNPDYQAPPGTKPPLMVLVHGGPTNRAYMTLDLTKQYWTSRGYALLDINYPGSVGYGRAYRDALNGRWGIADRDAVVAGALYLVKKGLVNPKKMIVKGESAGGYTVLRALTTTNTFQVGIDYFGWTDLVEAYKTTHRFESHYLDSLIGAYPQQQKLYRGRSPLYSADQLSGALLIFQGMHDPVVTPIQSKLMYQAVKAHGNPIAYITFPDEAHGFHQADTLVRCLQAERYFYWKILGIPVEKNLPPIKIENEPEKTN